MALAAIAPVLFGVLYLPYLVRPGTSRMDSFCIMFARWLSTVRTLKFRFCAISRLVLPSTTCWRTWTSQEESDIGSKIDN